jgi:hypothetical protein
MPRLVSRTNIIVEVTSEPKSVGVSVKSIETAGSLNGDHHVTQHRVHLTSEDMIDAPDVIAKVAQLETTFSLCLHLVTVPLTSPSQHKWGDDPLAMGKLGRVHSVLL